jgi:hypothetical protein
MLALAGLMNDQKMLKELRVARDEANAAITKLAGLNVQAAEAADCKNALADSPSAIRVIASPQNAGQPRPPRAQASGTKRSHLSRAHYSTNGCNRSVRGSGACDRGFWPRVHWHRCGRASGPSGAAYRPIPENIT